LDEDRHLLRHIDFAVDYLTFLWFVVNPDYKVGSDVGQLLVGDLLLEHVDLEIVFLLSGLTALG